MNFSALLRTLTGKNKTGQVIYGILDIAPIPPVHNLIRLAIKEKVPAKNMPAYVWQKLDKMRLTSSAIALSLGIAVAKGWLTFDDVKAIMEVLTYLLV